MKTGVVYVAINIKNNKSYIGLTTDLKKRIKKHYKDSKRYDHKFARALRKYDEKDWAWNVLYDNISMEQLNTAEICAIYYHDTYCNGYNSTIGGEGTKNFKHTKSTRDKLSKINKGKKKKPFTKEHRERISAANKGRKHTKEHIKNAAEARKGHERNAKTYKIMLPSGDTEIIKNLRKYCRENNLNRKSMMEVCKGKYKQHKGYKCEKMDTD